MTLGKVDNTPENNNPWYVTDNKFHNYWIWHGLFNSNRSLHRDINSVDVQKQSRYLKKQIVFQYFKNFFLFPILFLRLLMPWYLKGKNNVWTNIRTILKNDEFKPLRFAIFFQIIFWIILFCLGYISFYNYFQYTKAIENKVITNTISEVNNIPDNLESDNTIVDTEVLFPVSANRTNVFVSLILSDGNLEIAKQQVHFADQKIDELETLALSVNQNFDYKQILDLVSASQAMMLDIANNKDTFFQEADSEDVNNLFVRAMNHEVRRELVLNGIAINVDILLNDEQKNSFNELRNNISTQTKQFLDNTINDSRFDSSRDYLEKVRRNFTSIVDITDYVYLDRRAELVSQMYSGNIQNNFELASLDKNFQEYFGYNFDIFFNTYTPEDTIDIDNIVEFALSL
ncbi:MAG: hypothetical protein WC025_04055 [Candidatus Magasanikbacteria bacterium]